MGKEGRILIRGARIVDPASGFDAEGDILIEEGRIASVGEAKTDGAEVVEAQGLVAAPGFVDIHTHLREPGEAGGETVLSGTRAAVNGGYTSVCPMPNTQPAVDSAEGVAYQKLLGERAGYARVYPICAVTLGREGQALVEMAGVAAEGAVAFSDDGTCLATAKLVRKALTYAKVTGLAIIEHAEDGSLSGGGVMHSGAHSTALGFAGIPGSSEDVIVARDVILAQETGGRLHIAHVSTGGAAELVGWGKAKGAAVTAEVTPHHLVLDDSALESFHTSFKMKPPLRSHEDVMAVRKALCDGVIDCVATDHAPHRFEEKEVEFDYAAFGVTGLETAFGVLYTELVETGVMTLSRLVEVMSARPAEVLGLPGGTLSVGAAADVVLLDLAGEHIVEEEEFVSAAINSPFVGWKVAGKVVSVLVGGGWKKRDGAMV